VVVVVAAVNRHFDDSFPRLYVVLQKPFAIVWRRMTTKMCGWQNVVVVEDAYIVTQSNSNVHIDIFIINRSFVINEMVGISTGSSLLSISAVSLVMHHHHHHHHLSRRFSFQSLDVRHHFRDPPWAFWLLLLFVLLLNHLPLN
jgi:hypothetical protein